MLREARARMVDVETGERPTGMRPLEVDPPPEAPRPHRNAAVKRPTEPEPGAEPRDEPPGRPERPSPLDSGPKEGASAGPFGADGLLWLEDSPSEGDAPAAGDDGEQPSQPWRRGLRG